MGTETGYSSFTVKLFDYRVQRAFQISHGHALVNDHALYLVEHGRMGGIHLILAVHTARRDDTDGQFHGFHGAYLHGTCLAAQHHAAVFIKIKGVGPIAGRVAFFGVKLVKIVGGQFDLWSVEHGESHAYKNIFDLVQSDVHGMFMADFLNVARNGHIHRFCFELRVQSSFFQLASHFFQSLLQCGAHFVGQLSHDRPFLGAQPSHLFEYGG